LFVKSPFEEPDHSEGEEAALGDSWAGGPTRNGKVGKKRQVNEGKERGRKKHGAKQRSTDISVVKSPNGEWHQ